MILDVLIFYEHPARELESCLLLGAILKRLGLRVAIRSIPYQFWESQKSLHPRIVVTPWTSRRFFNLKSPTGKVPILFDLHQEQIGDAATEGIYQRCSDPYDQIYHAAWGKRFRNGIVSAGLSPENVFLTGYPRLDFYRPECKGLNFDKITLAEKYELDPKQQWVLVVSSFAAADLSRDDIKRFKSKGFFNIEELALEASSSRESTFKLLRELSKEGKGIQFIYRPHPAEASLDALVEGTGVKIIRGLDIRHWFLASDLALIWNSTSCIEAFLAKIPFFKFRPEPMDPVFEIPTMKHVPVVTKEDLPAALDFLQSLGKEQMFLKYSREYSLFKEDLAPNYELERSAIVSTAATILRLLKRSEQQDSVFAGYRYSTYRVAWESFRTRVRDWGIRAGWLPNVIPRYKITKNDMPSLAEEENITNQIARTVDLDAVVLAVRSELQEE